ncbi:MAG: tRNA (guanosine(37)-N1)-methyltransferase TrmD [Peptococcaceae bacterium]|nr:tRNA (guanosine(37)-N1)-methyltransferase TrmD [Peptococcaceae bacterium]
MIIDVLTLFPEMFAGPFHSSILKRALERGLLDINLVNIRDYSPNKHHTVDDTPYGGGAGMLMSPEPIFGAVEDVTAKRGRKPDGVILLCPQGEPLDQQLATELAREEYLILICGHYEGVDERVRAGLVTHQISVGDYVLTGGELPAMVLIDVTARLLPGVLGESDSVTEESFSDGLLEYPQYTRPREFRGLAVPDVLLSGHHEQIRLWRRRQAILRTLANRPELMSEVTFSGEDRVIIQKIIKELQDI